MFSGRKWRAGQARLPALLSPWLYGQRDSCFARRGIGSEGSGELDPPPDKAGKGRVEPRSPVIPGACAGNYGSRKRVFPGKHVFERRGQVRGSDQHLSSQEIQELAGFSADALPASLEDAMHHADSCDECRLRMLLSDELGLPSFSKTQSAPQPRTPACPPDSTWLQVAAGLESPDESRRQIQHASVCKRCGELLRVATEDLAVELSSEEEEKVA